MISSMTGFGSAEKAVAEWIVRAEARSVNHKDLQVILRVPESFSLREHELRKLIEEKVRRGNVFFTLSCQPRAGRNAALVDAECLKDYLDALRKVAAEHDLPFQVDLASLLRLPGAVRDMTKDEKLRDDLWPHVLSTAQATVNALTAMRRAEGENLRREMLAICQAMEDCVAAIEPAQATFVAAYRDKLKARLEKLLEGTGSVVSEDSLARELALYADRCDVSEEMARIRSHLKQFREALDEDGEPVGRKLEFLLQEMLREAGTTAAKVPDGPHLKDVLDLKGQIERLRQQVRNVE